ncbi:MAG: hypothetical protein ABC559_01950 [Candidatus Methanosuratincola petrocarbonis]
MEYFPTPAEVGRVHCADVIEPYAGIPWLLVYPDPWGAFMCSNCSERETVLWEVEVPDDSGVAASKITRAKDDWGSTARLHPGSELEIPDPSKLTRRVIFSGCYAAKWRKYLRCADVEPIMRLVACEGALDVLWSHYVDATCGRLALWGIQTACLNVCGLATEEELCSVRTEIKRAFAGEVEKRQPPLKVTQSVNADLNNLSTADKLIEFLKSREAWIYEVAAACTDPNPASALRRIWSAIERYERCSDIRWDFMRSLFNSLAAKALDGSGSLEKEELYDWMKKTLRLIEHDKKNRGW